MPITNLDFHFLKQGDEIRLEVFRRDNSQPLASTDVKFPSLLLSSFELRQLDFDDKDPELRFARLRAYGERLYKAVFTSDIDKIWREQKQATEFLALCVRIAPEVNHLETIPWETLFDGEDYIAAGARTTITRLPLDVAPQPKLEPVPLPVRMLALVSSPLDLADNSRLQMEREQEILLRAINDPAGQGRLRVDFEDEAKLDVLESSLETPYQIFHFTGHGLAPEDGGGLLLEDVRGNRREVAVDEVLQSLRRGDQHLRLAVLSGCQTARTLNVGGFRDMARGLLRSGVPSVLAMQFSISDEGGVEFAERFYSRLSAGRSLEQASHSARRALMLSENPQKQGDALAAVLLTANGDCLQTVQAKAEPTPEVPKIDFSFFLPLPQLSHGFYGRRREYREIRDAILHHNRRAVIVHGIGGIGKTALISHVATRMRKHFRGIYAFDCSSGTLSPETVMIKLHQYFVPQGINALEPLVYQALPVDMLANHLSQILSQWPLLLIFDNFESELVRDESGFRIADENLRMFINTLVKATATGSHFLFTTRYLFELDEKRVGTIQPLALEDLSNPEALSLMQKLPSLAAASYSEKLAALDAFGGHPYALVTLDRYCHHQSLEQALEEAKSIHTELRSFLAIELNYAKLTERSRQCLNGLAAFRKAVPFDAAEWVLGDRVPPPPKFIEVLRKAAEKAGLGDDESLARLIDELPQKRVADDAGQPIRELVDWGLLTPIQDGDEILELSVHTLVRDFCRDQLTKEPWRQRLRDAAAFYTNWTKIIKREERSPEEVWGQVEAFELLMAAEEADQASHLLMDASELLERWGFGRYLESLYLRLLGNVNEQNTELLYHNFGNLMEIRGDYAKALEYYQSSLAIAERHSNGPGIAQSLFQIGVIHQSRGDLEKALELCERAHKIFEDLGDELSVAKSLHQICNIHFAKGNNEEALRGYERALKIFEERQDKLSIAITVGQIGLIHFSQKNLDKARDFQNRALQICQELGDSSGIGRALHHIGVVHHAQGNHEQALNHLTQAIEIFSQREELRGLADSIFQIGRVFTAMGRYEEAFANLLFALSTYLQLESPYSKPTIRLLDDLRTKWGVDNFDAAWKEATGGEVPSFFNDSLD
jgi:tetratricopeptide (TPR) repeat protein/CHAT domain-containing protein